MAVKTDARKSVAEPSLFDVFGPDVSDQVKAVNQRAAELSMDDMARVMDQAGCTVKESWESRDVTVRQITGRSVEFDVNKLQVFFSQINKTGSAAYELVVQDSPYDRGYENLCHVNVLRLNTVYKISPAAFRAGLTKGKMQVHKAEAVEPVCSNMTHLHGIGDDSSKKRGSTRKYAYARAPQHVATNKK